MSLQSTKENPFCPLFVSRNHKNTFVVNLSVSYFDKTRIWQLVQLILLLVSAKFLASSQLRCRVLFLSIFLLLFMNVVKNESHEKKHFLLHMLRF